MLVRTKTVDVATFERGTGWALKPEGACRGDVCVPLGEAAVRDGAVDLAGVAERLGMPLVRHSDDLFALGPATSGGQALVTAAAPDLTLPDLDGDPFQLASLRGQKVVLVAWAPY